MADCESESESRTKHPIVAWHEVARVFADGRHGAGLPDWALAAFGQVTGILDAEDFPCVFARRAKEMKSGWLCFVESIESNADREAVRRAILAYFDVIRRTSRERTVLMPLMVIVKPRYPMLSLKHYRDQAWGLFQYLHDNDAQAWPVEVPTDPDRGDWCLCFDGIQLFSNVSAPAHRIHKSRNLGDSLVFAMQPRTNFDLVGGNNPKGRMVRNEIRKRAERYEGRPISPHLGFYGTSENREWLQMATKDSEEDLEFPDTCPFKFNPSKRAIAAADAQPPGLLVPGIMFDAGSERHAGSLSRPAAVNADSFERARYRLYGAPGRASAAPEAVLEELGVAYEYIHVDADSRRSEAYRKFNPLGQVPTLVDNDLVITEAAAICNHLCDRHPEAGLAPPIGSAERARFYQWLFFLSNTLQPAYMLFIYPERYCSDGVGAAELSAQAAKRITALWGQIDDALEPGPFLLGERMSACDAYLYMLSTWHRDAIVSLSRFERVRRYVSMMTERPGIRRMMVRNASA